MKTLMFLPALSLFAVQLTYGQVTNINTHLTCSIVSAKIDAPQTWGGHTLIATSGTFTENISVNGSSSATRHTIYESIEAVAVHGNYAYAGVGKRLVVLSVASSSAPAQVTSIDVPDGSVMDVVVSNNRAYVAAGGAGLRVMDISEPTNPKEIGFINTPGYAEGVAVAGQYAYMADGGAGVRVIDISDPTHPREVGFVYVLGYAFNVVVVGNYAFVAAAGAGLRVVDISDLIHPVEVGGCDTPGYAYGLTVVGNTAYVADGWEGLRVIDVSNPRRPREVGFYDTPGWTFEVAVVGNLAYVADAFAGMRVIDVSNQAHPIEIGAYEPRGDIHDVAVVGSMVYAADRRCGLRVVQVSIASRPTQVGFCRMGDALEADRSAGGFGSMKPRFESLAPRPDLPLSGKPSLQPMLPRKRDVEKVDMRLEPVGQIGGHTQAVAVEGDYAYVGIGLRVEVLDISDSTNPQQVGSTGMLDGFVSDIAIAGSYAYVTVGGKGLWIVDISDPTRPNELGFLRTPGYAEGVAVAGNYAYVAAGGAGVRVVDISDKTHPREISFVYTLGYAFDVEVVGNVAYVAGAGAGLRVVDVSDPKHPTEVGEYNTPGYAYGVAGFGSTVYVADGWQGLRVIDVSDPTQPTEIGAVEAPVQALGVAVLGTIAYVTDASAGLRVIDVSDPTDPTELGLYMVSGGRVKDVAVVGSIAFVIDRNWGLRVVDVSDPTTMTQIGFYGAMGSVEAVAVLGDYAYVGAGSSLRVVDISDPVHPKEVGIYDTQGGSPTDVVISGTYAYVSTSYGSYNLHIVDISDPTHPKMTGGIRTGTGGAYREIAVAGQIVYVADEWGLRLISVSDPTAPNQIGFINLWDKGQPTIGIAVSGTIAYLAGSTGGVAIVDVSDSFNPKLVGSCYTPGTTQGVAVTGSRAYTANSQSGLRIVDVSNPSMPTEMGFFDTPGCAMSVTISDMTAYVSDGGGGIQIVDVSNPFTPTLIMAYDTPGWVTDMTLAGDYVYVADRLGGLLILKKTTKQITSKYDTTGTCIVTSTADSGAGTLRHCLENAKAGDTITFDPVVFPPTSATPIKLNAPLPTLTQGHLTIDASNAGVILDGSNTPEGTFGLLVASDSNKIMGLQVLNFPANGIMLNENADFNTIGGDNSIGNGPTGEGNVISANGPTGGLHIYGSDNIVQGNFIGTDATGSVALGNAWGGLQLGGQRNFIGGIVAGQRNIISGNNEGGLVIGGTNAVNNTIVGNFIGTDASGTTALGNNPGIGIAGGASYNRVGGNTPEERNIISGNRDCGIVLILGGVTRNIFVGNYIGTDVTGEKALGNVIGVMIEDGPFNNVIGGTNPNEKNIISGNGVYGVVLSGVAYNTVIGNFIGTDATGTAALANRDNGVLIWNADFNRIGGTRSGERNISSSNGCGINIGGSSQNNLVLGNYIGTDVNGIRPLLNAWWIGVSINEGTRHNFVGGTTEGERNVISGWDVGVEIADAGIEYNWIAGNFIGTDATGTVAIGNTYGLRVENASNNYIGPGNLFANNANYGVRIRGSIAIGNTISRNSITNNNHEGIINQNGGNIELSPPVISSISDTCVTGSAPPNCTIEIFSDPQNEGKVYEGATSSDSVGNFEFIKPDKLIGPNVTATATDIHGNTSEFSVEIPTGIEENKSIPFTYELYQNYPNPFNLTTTIKYSIPKIQFVTLKIYDVLGREIKTLIHEEKLPGNYEIKFDGSGLASSIYIYRLVAEKKVLSRKFVLLK
ncbi:MAG: T9SS type A sorting domain-containing protein [Bacteroidetes bacterium]|nr:T9SS type A sorting domain-containing protein [Patescibacteria group bacterium]MBU2446400.1 T9SS type A sorting domain-containing protein [Bacteroidota bacterium]